MMRPKLPFSKISQMAKVPATSEMEDRKEERGEEKEDSGLLVWLKGFFWGNLWGHG